MSLILDALKKIEQDKRRAAESGGTELVAASHSRFGGRQNWISMGAMAIVSALLTAAAVSFLNSREAEVAPVVEEASAALTARSPDLDEPETPEPAITHIASPAAPAVETERAPVTTSPAERSAKPAAVTIPDSNPEADGAPEPGPESRTPDVVEPAEPTDTRDDVSQPIRLVGQERVLLDALNVGKPSDSMGARSENNEPLPAGFPELVLQGTSVIGGNAVAVISDQRVFEGDRIEGALVIRIGEREVELEVDGTRFTLRL